MEYVHGSRGVSRGGPSKQSPRLMDEVRRRIRLKHYSLRTEQAYTGWIRRFILANGKRHPRDLGAAEVEQFLSRLAVEGNVAASTQNQALAALLFLYREVLGQELPWMNDIRRAKRPERLPVVLTRAEVASVLVGLSSVHGLMASLLCRADLRKKVLLLQAVRSHRVGSVTLEISAGSSSGSRPRVISQVWVSPASCSNQARVEPRRKL